ncbi:MAG TPA: hypothetical protein PLD59_00240 [Tepidisphaeraceae bacterium]|nr:hypothetical protein [Tepidisphaeraceae bacterium]
MSEQSTGFMSRIASIFTRKNRLEEGGISSDLDSTQPPSQLVETRQSIFRPWAKRDHALQNLSEGFVTLTRLMSGIRDNLEKQNTRQEDLMRVLSQLPQMIETIPESNRSQAEALKTIYTQLAQQNQAQTTLGEVLNRICDTSGEQKSLINSLNDQLDSLRQTDASISSNISNVGTAMQSLSEHSATSTQVLQQVQSGMSQRDAMLNQLLEKQNHRFNAIFWASVVLSITTILSLVMVTYLAMK